MDFLPKFQLTVMLLVSRVLLWVAAGRKCISAHKNRENHITFFSKFENEIQDRIITNVLHTFSVSIIDFLHYILISILRI